MKLSVLLPTRNGGRYVGDCIASVLATELENLELVVSDNASEDDTQEVLAAFAGDPRLRIVRQPESISVTDNWTAALQASTGEYVLLLGDDDCLLPGALDQLVAAHAEFGAPEVLSFEAYGFAFPGALDPGSPAHFSDPLFPYDQRLPRQGILAAECRAWSVREFFRFELPLCTNLQTILCSRDALKRLPYGPFREPYPDFYAVNALLLTAHSWVHLPRKLVAVGISPKSFGRTLKHGGTDAGRAYLGIDVQFDGYLPGTDMLNGVYVTLQHLRDDFSSQLAGVEISRSNYVYRQMYSWYLSARLRSIDRAEIVHRLRLLSAHDWIGFLRELTVRLDLDMLRRHARVDDSSAIASVWANMNPAPEHRTIREFAAWAGTQAA
jgi:glycosyltransferase involved in cell wall biosynthesis